MASTAASRVPPVSAVESVAEKAETARGHPVRPGAVLFLIASVALGVVLGIKSADG